MEIGNTQYKKKDVIIKSIIWNTIIEIFKKEKNIDITDSLTSIQIQGFKITIRSNTPIIHTELANRDDIIKKILIEKLQRLGIPFEKYEMKYT